MIRMGLQYIADVTIRKLVVERTIGKHASPREMAIHRQ